MGVDACVISGIGRVISEDELNKLFNLDENDNNYRELFDEKLDDNDKYSDNLFYITNDGGIGEQENYYIILNDLFKDGIENIQKRINKFVRFLRDNNLSIDIKEISVGYFG